MKQYDLIVLENAAVDILLKVNDSDIVALGLQKGTSAAINGSAADMKRYFKCHNPVAIPGGSGANIAVHAAVAGAKTAFLGTVGNDEYGLLIEDDFKRSGVNPCLSKKPGHTGVCYTLITPDAERTMVFDGELAMNYTMDDIDLDIIKSARYLHTSMYALSSEPQRAAVLHAMDIAKKSGIKVSFDLANAPLVSSNREFVKDILRKYIDIAIANENEAEALSGSIESAKTEFQRLCKTSIIKFGANGSIITHNGQACKIPAFPAKVVDTTGAGDSYLGTYLAQVALGKSMEEAGIAASRKAAEIISRIGAR